MKAFVTDAERTRIEARATTRVARQAEQPRDKPGKARDEDALRAKVRDALTARQRMNAKADPEKPQGGAVTGWTVGAGRLAFEDQSRIWRER
jgi:hypothetical protein